MRRTFKQIKNLIEELEAKGIYRTSDEEELLEELKLINFITKDGVHLNESLKMDPKVCPVCGK
ncbi:TPA: hypothetical protein ACGA31_001309 [Clostridium perfringens]